MGTWAHVVVVDGPRGAVGAARHRVEELESRWSRFRPDSEVSRLNRAGGRPLAVSSDTARLVALALSAWRATAGRFDPTVLGAVVDAGYDRSFERLADPTRGDPSGLARGAGAVAVDERQGTVALPAGVGLDPGGMGKGLAADMVVAELVAAGASGACVNLGGDLRAEGAAPGGGPWVVDVEHPDAGPRPAIARLAFDAGAVATSSCLRRTWRRAGHERHHLIDPATGLPGTGPVVAATVLTGDAWRAEALATAAALTDPAGALRLLDAARAVGLLVDRQGRVHRSAGLGPFLA